MILLSSLYVYYDFFSITIIIIVIVVAALKHINSWIYFGRGG